MSVIRLIDEYHRWRSYGYDHQECVTAIRNREGGISELGTDQEIEAVVKLLDKTGPVDRETTTRLLKGGEAVLEILEGKRPMDGGD